MKKKIIDANYLLRYFLADNERQNLLAAKVIENEEVLLINEVVAEVCYVLEKVYVVPKKEIDDILNLLLDYKNITAEKTLIRNALNLYSLNNLDFVDALLIAYNKIEGAEICSFDKKLNKLLNKV